MKKDSVVNKQPPTDSVEDMQFVRLIRSKSGLNPWKISKALDKSVQSYLSLERKSNKISLQDLVGLYEVSGLNLNDFWDLLAKSAKKGKKLD